MYKLVIQGGNSLKGNIKTSGSKNATLPIFFASILSDDPLKLANTPQLSDVSTTLRLLMDMGSSFVLEEDGSIFIDSSNLKNLVADYSLVKTMRASILTLGPTLAKYKKAKISLPGGCAIGTRPVDIHLSAFKALGAEIELKEGYIKAHAKKGLKGANILFPSVSVGATENVMMAATLAEGETQISNAAREPEVGDLANCLVAMGANIEGIGTDTLKVTGVSELKGANHEVIPDRIETGTYAVAAAMTGGDIIMKGTRLELLNALADVLAKAGVEIAGDGTTVRVRRVNSSLKGTDLMTEPYPGFPTDMQAQVMALLAVADGASMITETIFENRFMHVPELCRMGADINVYGSSAIVRGVPTLSGAQLMATDLRASVSLVLAGLAANGETFVNRVYHLDRGYERVEEKLAACGAEIERISDG